MIMSVHEPISRKRLYTEDDRGFQEEHASKKQKEDTFSEKMYSSYVRTAFESLDRSDPNQVDALTSKINLPQNNPDSIKLANFSIILKCIISNVSRLDNTPCTNLVHAILHYNWLDPKAVESSDYQLFTETYSHFLSVLVSSFPKYLHDVSSKLISEFTDINCKNSIFPHHRVLRKLISFIPTCLNTFPLIIQKHIPHHLSSEAEELALYISNLMEMISYCPELQFSIWQIVIECCIKLDVELQNELDDLDDDEIEELINGEHDEDEEVQDGDAVVDSNGAGIEEEEEEGEVEYLVNPITSTGSIKKLVFKLDSIVNLLLTSTKSSFTSEELNNGHGVSLFNTITSLFKSHVLPTHFTKSIQFILFHISQYQQELSDSFLVLLIDVAFNPKEILEKRLKALQYLSSYIARAKNLSRHQVVFMVSYLIGWLNKYVVERESEVNDVGSSSDDTRGGMERFKLFYSTFQTLLYIFCFRHKLLYKEDFEGGNNQSEWECDLDKFFQRVILAKFNPLKFCDETVVYIFAKIATKLNVCYCYSIIEHNKRETMLQNNSSMPSTIGNFKLKQEFLDLEAYFPFDPLVLPMSKTIVKESYVEWSDVNPNEDDDEDDESGTASIHEDDEEEDTEESDEEITSEEDDE